MSPVSDGETENDNLVALQPSVPTRWPVLLSIVHAHVGLEARNVDPEVPRTVALNKRCSADKPVASLMHWDSPGVREAAAGSRQLAWGVHNSSWCQPGYSWIVAARIERNTIQKSGITTN